MPRLNLSSCLLKIGISHSYGLSFIASIVFLEGGLAGVMGASRILFAMMRELFPTSRMARLSLGGSSPVLASLCVIGFSFAGYAP